MKKYAVLLLLFLCFTLVASAKETVIYENDFSSTDLSAFTVTGSVEVKNGLLRATDKGTSGAAALVSYTLPKQYQGKDYIVEADYIGATTIGGVTVGATGDSLNGVPSFFSGYAISTTKAGKTDFNCFALDGSAIRLCPGTNSVPEDKVHLYARAHKGVLTVRATSLDGKTLYQEFRYELGDSTSDIYDTFTSTMGLYQYYGNNGGFDNFKVTILEDDVLPAMNSTVTLGGVTFASSGLTAQGEAVSGSGAMLSKDAQSGNYRIVCSVAAKGNTRLYFGMKDAKNGYAFEINERESAVYLYKITDGVYTWLGEKENIIRSGLCDVTLDVHDGIASLYYDNLYQGADAFPKFEFYLDGTDGKFGYWLEGGRVQGIAVGGSTVTLPEETYLNPVCHGADPDVLYYNGTYYLYVAENNGTDIFRLYTSPDLAHFTKRNIVFTWDPAVYDNVRGGTCWSPNIFYSETDKLFYIFFAAEPHEGDTRLIYYVTSDSPYGPFTHNGPLKAIHDGPKEIDGHPFVGYDGKTYMSYSRYDMGGTIWLDEIIIKDGEVTAVPNTLTRVIIPDREWDNDGGHRLCEGGFVWKHDGLYYLIYATVKYERHYGEAVAVSENPLGPYVKYDYNPILTHNFTLDGPGDALMIHSPDGEEVYMVYHRHNQVGTVSPRQVCVDLVEFVENPDDKDGADILTVRGPSSTPQQLPSNKYRFDVNRDNAVTLVDALLVLNQVVDGGDYSGYYDVDANGSIGLGDVLSVLKKLV